MTRPKYLLDCDAVQDALNEAGDSGMTISQLVETTGRNYTAIQQATVRLRKRCFINFERHGNKLHFYALLKDRKT